jgi:hypothetical protein
MRTRHDGVPGAGHVGVDGVAEGLGGDLIPWCGTADSGIGDDDVETAQLADRLIDGSAEHVEVTDIDHPGDDSSAVGAHQLCCLGQVVGCRRIVWNAGGQRPG